MMIRSIIAVLFAGWAGLVMAAAEGGSAPEDKKVAQMATEPPPEPAPVEVAPAPATVPAPAESAVPPATSQPTGVPPASDAAQTEPRSSIPLEKRKGGDITKCLEAGSKSDKDIAACAEKYRP